MEGGGDKTPTSYPVHLSSVEKGSFKYYPCEDIVRHIQKGEMEIISGTQLFQKKGHGLVTMCYLSLSCLFFNGKFEQKQFCSLMSVRRWEEWG